MAFPDELSLNKFRFLKDKKIFILTSMSGQQKITPASREELIAAVREACAYQQKLIPYGSGTHQRMGHPPQDGAVLLHSTRLNRVLEFSEKDFTITVEAGMTLENLHQTLQSFPPYFPYGDTEGEKRTIGGIASVGKPNFFSYRYRELRDLILGLTICQADGAMIKTGSKVVKNVSGYEMPKLFIGSFGTLGFILDATLRLYPRPQTMKTITGKCREISGGMEILKRIFSSTLNVTGAHLFISIPAISVSARVEGKPKFVADVSEKVKWIFRNCRAEEIREAEGGSPLMFPVNQQVLCYGRIPPDSLFSAYRDMNAVSEALEMTGIFLFSLDGFFQAGWEGKIAENMVSQFEGFNKKIAASGGWIVYRYVPLSLWSGWPMWGEEHGEWRISKKLKRALDPGNMWNPGRFV